MQATLFDPPTPAKPAANSRGIIPRDYQARGIAKTFEEFERGAAGVLLASHTGSGKTLLGSLCAERWLSQGENYRVMICAHERQLVTQFAEEVEFFTGIRPGIEMAEQRVKMTAWGPRIVVSSRATLQERNNGVCRLKHFDPMGFNWLLIVDECHRWAYGLKTCRRIFEWFDQNQNSRHLGLTATPERGDGVSLARMFPTVGLDFPLYDLDGRPCGISEGWAVPYDQRFIAVHGVEWRNVREAAGDFRDEDLQTLLMDQGEVLKLVKPLLDLVGNRRTIIFNPGTKMTKAVAHTINALIATPEYADKEFGLAEALDGSVPDLIRNEVYKRHQAGRFQFLSVCGLCREGYNDPGIQAVAVFRPTKSRSLAEQMKGRGCRPLRGIVDGLDTKEQRLAAIAASAKPACMVIDLVGITGMPPVVSTLDLLANGRPDEVKEAAARIIEAAKELGEPVDVVKAVKTAEGMVEEARRIREEREAREREEYQRRARLNGDVAYSERRVGMGETGGSRSRNAKQYKHMPYGRYKGKPLRDIPSKYLESVILSAKGKLRDSINGEINRRKNRQASGNVTRIDPAGPCLEAQARVLARFGYPVNVSFEKAAGWIKEINQRGRESK